MLTVKQIIFASALFCALLATAAAQDRNSAPAQSSSLTITAAAAGERVRITAPSSVVQMHVEVYAASGERLFDQEIRGGNVFDWHLQNGQGQRLAPGSYVCLVTAKSVSGKLTQKIGTVSIEAKSATVHVATSQQLSALQAQAIGPVEENPSWKISGGDEPQTATVIAHNGTEGQMIRGRGALTFRVGNFFTGNDREQMRLTEDGRLGIGTSDPRATLDVAGTIRAQRFLIAKPKAMGTGVSAQDSLTANATEPEEALITGTGTQDRIAKWIDNAATLGDSSITEIGGNVGIGTTSPGSRLVVSANSTNTLPPALGIARFADADGVQTAVFADSFGTNPIFNVRRANGTAAAPSAVQANQLLGVIGASGYGASTYSGTRARVGFFASENWTNTANGTHLTFNTTANGTAPGGGTERMRIDNAGNIGIGTPSPQELLNVNGNIRWGGTTTNFVRSGQDAGGLFLEQHGNSAATSGVRIQSSKSGNAADYSQFFINPNNGFSFMKLGTGNGNVGIGTMNPLRALQFGESLDALFTLEPGDITPNAGFIRFGDGSGWKLHIGRSRESSGGPLNAGTQGVIMTIQDNGRIGVGTTTPSNLLYALDFGAFDAHISQLDVAEITLTSFDTFPGDNVPVCRHTFSGLLKACPSSLRYKTEVRPYAGGLSVINRLRPITFRWIGEGKADVGLGAEDVAEVEPLFTFKNEKGVVEGVRYDRLSAVFINSFKEQQAQLEQQQKLISQLGAELKRLNRRVRRNRTAR